MNILARPSGWARSAVGPEKQATPAGRGQHYFAFLSYSHRDEAIAKWLHEELEKFRTPSYLVGRLTDHGPVPRRLTPVFRDLHELPASGDLGSEIREAIAGSRFLIVLCSPAAAESRWTNAEIEAFKRLHEESCILAAIVDGEPFASDIPGRESEECLPVALRYHYDRRGHRTPKRAEPLAADLREPGEARRLGFLKLVAGMLGLGLDDLVRREALRRQRRLALITAASLAGMVVTSGLAVTAIQARDAARDQRQEAESLIGFMLGDLRERLEPIGRLDALDDVGARVLAYYQQQDTSDLPDASLMQRSRALALMAEVANFRGDLNEAERLYRAAMVGTTEAIRRAPDDPQRLFDHAQHVFWTADIALRRGDTQRAEAAFREYQRLARRMVALDPDNMKWRVEVHNADANLGIILFKQRRFAEASRQFERAFTMIRAIATADPGNRAYQDSLTESLAWMADSHLAEGRLDIATAERERHVELLDSLLRRTGDLDWGYKLTPAHRALGNLYAWRGQVDLGTRHMQEAAAHAEQLLSVEPQNSKWTEHAAKSRLSLADLLLGNGRTGEAAAQINAGCALIGSLISRDQGLASWRELRRDCLLMRTKHALAARKLPEALSLSGQALNAASAVKSTDPVADAYLVAKAHRLAGDSHHVRGNSEAAAEAWEKALAALPHSAGERPSEASERLSILKRLGRTADAQQLARKLSTIGFRDPEFKPL